MGLAPRIVRDELRVTKMKKMTVGNSRQHSETSINTVREQCDTDVALSLVAIEYATAVGHK